MTQAEANAQSNSAGSANNEESPSSNTPFVVKRLVGQRDKLREQNGSLNSENDDLAKEIARLKQENEALKNQGKPSARNLPPVPGDFESDDEFRIAQQEYTARVAQQTVNQHLQNQQKEKQQSAFDSRVNDHYDRVEKSGLSDYEQAELNALNELGQEFLDGVVENSDNSEQILYMLGSNPEEMKRIKTLLHTNPVKATMEIGRLSVVAGNYSKENPVPETVLKGGGTPKAAVAGLEKKYQEAVARAAETGDSKGLREIRRQMREAGLL